jgi:Xaa-Pro aminopeptidase
MAIAQERLMQRSIPPFAPTKKPIAAGAKATRRLLPYVPQMSLAERDRRWDRARKRMIMHGYDALILLGNDIYWGMGMANLRYLLQVDSQIGADALFPLDGDPVVWNAVPHMNRPTSPYLSVQEWSTDFRSRGGPRVIAEEIKTRGLDKSKIGLVGYTSTIQPSTLLYGDVVALKELLPGARIDDASGLLQEMRMIKSDEEVDMLRGAGRIARKVIDTMRESARPGVTDAEVFANMTRTHLANGGEPNIFNLFSAGPVEHPADELWHLLHGCEQPLWPTMRPLEEGDIVLAEWHTKYGGYRCHTEYTVYLGKHAPKQLRHIWDVGVECLEASKEALTAGRTIREALEIIRAPARRAKLDWVELGFHAMGTASPEFPTVVYDWDTGTDTLNGYRIGEMVLEEGMCFGNNVDLHDSEWKPDVGTMLSDFMVVRPGRAECLVGTPTEFPAVW